MPSTYVINEIYSQPDVWQSTAALLPSVADSLPRHGERVAVVGCGTSWFVAMSYAVYREQNGFGVTDPFVASEFPLNRSYDRVVAISRSGTTTEIVRLLAELDGVPTTVLTAVADSPVTAFSRDSVLLSFADESSVVQTRFATSVLTLLRAHLGMDIDRLVADGRRALVIPIDDLLTVDQVTFLGRGAAVGLAQEAALKSREAAQFWAEAYPALDYRHGPIAVAQPGRLVWSLGDLPPGLADDIAATGARLVCHDLDPLAGLIVAQRFAVALAMERGLDVDHPRALTRSVILP